MAEITKPMALDESLNTTESSPRNIADVLAQGIGNLVTVVSRISQQTVYDELDKLNDVNVTSPANNDVLKYNSNTQKWENGQGGGSSSCEELIAPVEASTTASQAYAIGEQFILNGTLYTATAAITAGGTITIGGNCTASDTVTEQIGQLNVKVTSNVLTGVSTKYTIPSEIRYQKNRYVTYMGKFTFLNLTIVCVTPTSSSEAVVSGLPNPIDDFDNTFIISAPSMDATSQILCFLQNGILYVLGGVAGTTYKLSTYYPSK